MRNRPVLAVFVAALIPMIVGAIWYAPSVFGRAWERAHGYDDPTRMAALQDNVVRNYLAAFVTYLVMALVLRFLLYRLAASDARSAIQIAFLCWLGFVLTVGLTSILFAQLPLSLLGIDGSFQFIYMLLMALVLRPPAPAATTPPR